MNRPAATFIGPVVSREGGFAFDTFSLASGLKRGFAYRCVEQADYDRKTTLRRAAVNALLIPCDTLAEFQRRCAGFLETAAAA
jgi:hypothetical protein